MDMDVGFLFVDNICEVKAVPLILLLLNRSSNYFFVLVVKK